MKFYRQTTNYTCGPSCVLMILNSFWPKRFPLNKDNEHKIWLRTTNPLIRGCPDFALAKFLEDSGLKTKIIHLKEFSPDNYVRRFIKPKDYQAYYASNLFHKKQALKGGVKFEKRKIRFEELKNWLIKYDFIILLVEVKTLHKKSKNYHLHWILLNEYKNKKFLVYDPWRKKSWISERLLKSAFDNVRNKIKADNRAILIKLIK